VIEVAVSSASYDLHDKRRVYRRSGVQEYLVWRIDDAALDWWKLEDGEYQPLAPAGSEILRSAAFPGLTLNVAALLAGDPAAVLAGLRPAP
jgi:Uma2 family endonuclease